LGIVAQRVFFTLTGVSFPEDEHATARLCDLQEFFSRSIRVDQKCEDVAGGENSGNGVGAEI
jgi:hypothetical protein